jgi:hypothetical protein
MLRPLTMMSPGVSDVIDEVVHPVEVPEQRRFSAAGRPDEGHHLTLGMSRLISKSACLFP